jgi:hypothetical protein
LFDGESLMLPDLKAISASVISDQLRIQGPEFIHGKTKKVF